MFWYCVEDQRLISILAYEPTVSPGVQVIPITPQQHQDIEQGRLWFDPAKTAVVPVPDPVKSRQSQDQRCQQLRSFLANTDWQVLRHIREQALGLPTSLTQAQYLDLEQQRQQAAKNIGISPFSSNNG